MSEIDEEKLHELLGAMVQELGAAANGPLVIVGEKLGLYRALAQHGPLDAGGLAERTDTNERYVREWLSAQAASGYIEYDAEAGEFSMTPEQVAVFADPDSPVLMPGGFFGLVAMYKETDLLTDVFRSGEGIAWGDHDDCLFCGTEKFFKPTYEGNLVSDWIPALDGVHEKLEGGARVADVGCGRAASTRIMARAYPDSEFVGFDFHAPSIAYAREAASEAGLENLTFEVATAKEYPGDDYDLVCFFDCLHDMGDPAGAAGHVRETLDADGTWMIVEPMAGDSLAENMNPVGRAFYAFSTAICTPSSLSQEVGLALGAQAGEERLREVVTAGGFREFRRATETPFNLILEARP